MAIEYCLSLRASLTLARDSSPLPYVASPLSPYLTAYQIQLKSNQFNMRDACVDTSVQHKQRRRRGTHTSYWSIATTSSRQYLHAIEFVARRWNFCIIGAGAAPFSKDLLEKCLEISGVVEI